MVFAEDKQGALLSAVRRAWTGSAAFLVLMVLWIGVGNSGWAQGTKDSKPGEAKQAKEAPAKTKTTKTKKKSAVVNRNNDAYEKIKTRRREIVKKYLEVLFAAAEQCAEDKKVEACRTLTDRILKVVEPPKNRRKVGTTASGVAVDKEGERAAAEGGEEPKLLEVKQKPLRYCRNGLAVAQPASYINALW